MMRAALRPEERLAARLPRPLRVTRLNEVPGPRPAARRSSNAEMKRGATGRYFTGADLTLMDAGSLEGCRGAGMWSYFQR